MSAKETVLCRKLNRKEIGHETYCFEEWVEVNSEVKKSAVEAQIAFEHGFKRLYHVLFEQRPGDSLELEAEADIAIKEHMNFEMWSALNSLLEPESAPERAIKGHAKRYPVIDFVKNEWAKYRNDYDGNKSEFARIYSRRVLNEHGLKVTEKQIREVWLKDTPVAINQAR